MDLKVQLNTVKLLRQIADPTASTVPCIPHSHGERALRLGAGTPLPRCAPRDQGVPDRYVLDFAEALQQDRQADIHSVLIVKNGHVIFRAGFDDYDPRLPHQTFSLCKSLVGLAVGMLIEEGGLTLDTGLGILRRGEGRLNSLLARKNIRVRHLLTMSSGAAFGEAGAVTEADWVKAYGESGQRFAPGTAFHYNSMNTYMLSAMVREVTGEGLTDYLRPRLFEPLGMSSLRWETCPMGIEKGGWGLYMAMEDVAKVGVLMLRGGVWQGQQLVPARWVEEATRVHMPAAGPMGDYDYGYQLWVCPGQGAFLFNGMFGQNMYASPQTDTVVVTTAGNGDLMQKGGLFALLHRYFGGDYTARLPAEQPGAAERLRALEQSGLHKRDEAWMQAAPWRELSPGTVFTGRRYAFDREQTAGIGILPLLLQTVQNNFTRGLCAMTLEQREEELYLTVEEGEECFRLPVGFGRGKRATLSLRGERYPVSTRGEMAVDEDRALVLKMRISFLEMAAARSIKIRFCGGEIQVQMEESPGRRFLEEGLQIFTANSRGNRLLRLITRKIDGDVLAYAVSRAFEPRFTGYGEPT